MLLLLMEGMEAREVAQRLGISYYTVRAHIFAMRENSGAHNITQLVTMVLDERIGDLETDLQFEYDGRMTAEKRLEDIPFSEIAEVCEDALSAFSATPELRRVIRWLRRAAEWAVSTDGLMALEVEGEDD